MQEAFSKEKQLFTPSPHSNKLFPNDQVMKYVANSHEHYLVIGKLLGITILYGLQITVPIARYVIKQIFHKQTTGTQLISDLAELDQQLFENLMSLKNMDPQRVQDLDLNFEYTDSSGRSVELIPDGKNTSVTKENRLLYIEKVAKLKLSTGIEQQLNSIKDGLEAVFPSYAHFL